LFFLV
jgi:hypothetical protein